jgi:hypothetical protein
LKNQSNIIFIQCWILDKKSIISWPARGKPPTLLPSDYLISSAIDFISRVPAFPILHRDAACYFLANFIFIVHWVDCIISLTPLCHPRLLTTENSIPPVGLTGSLAVQFIAGCIVTVASWPSPSFRSGSALTRSIPLPYPCARHALPWSVAY